jgi:hypothetical protein
MLEGGFNVLVAVDLEDALQELGRPDYAEKQWQEAHAAGETNAVSVLLIRNCRRDRSLAKGVIQGSRFGAVRRPQAGPQRDWTC